MTYMMVLGAAYCCGDELLGAADGIGQIEALSKIGGNGRREGAACAVEIAAVDSGSCEFYRAAIGGAENIGHLAAIGMAALKKIGVGTKGTSQLLGLGKIRGYERAEWEEMFGNVADDIGLHKQESAGRNHYGVVNHRCAMITKVIAQQLYHNLGHSLIREHANLNGAGLKIGKHRTELRGNNRGWNCHGRLHTESVLRGERCYNSSAITAQSGYGLEILLNAGSC